MSSQVKWRTDAKCHSLGIVGKNINKEHIFVVNSQYRYINKFPSQNSNVIWQNTALFWQLYTEKYNLYVLKKTQN